jgi:hypothetical protein
MTRRNNGCDEGTCSLCARRTQRMAGRWCWPCYRRVTGDSACTHAATDPGREQRIRQYTKRARREKPLFDPPINA